MYKGRSRAQSTKDTQKKATSDAMYVLLYQLFHPKKVSTRQFFLDIYTTGIEKRGHFTVGEFMTTRQFFLDMLIYTTV